MRSFENKKKLAPCVYGNDIFLITFSINNDYQSIVKPPNTWMSLLYNQTEDFN